MIVEKHKRQHTLPNRQLAKVFGFSAADLAANRHGYITRAQTWSVPLWLRAQFHEFGERSFWKNRHSPRRQSAEMVCGRANLSYQQWQVQSIFHTDIIEVYKLTINSFEFRITSAQHEAIGEGVLYRVYYDPDSKQILSLERAIIM